MATPELDEAAYEFTEGDARKVLAGYANARRNAESRTLMTKQMREAEQERKAAAYGRVPVRVELPDGHVVQATFAAVEKLQALHSLVASVLVPEVASAFYLFTAPPKVELKDPGVSLYAAGLVPAARVHVGFRNAAALPEYKGCLNDEAMALLGDPPARAEAMGRPAKTVFEQKEGSEGDERAPANRTAGPAAEGEGRPRRPKAGMPSWMKLSSA